MGAVQENPLEEVQEGEVDPQEDGQDDQQDDKAAVKGNPVEEGQEGLVDPQEDGQDDQQDDKVAVKGNQVEEGQEGLGSFSIQLEYCFWILLCLSYFLQYQTIRSLPELYFPFPFCLTTSITAPGSLFRLVFG